MRDFRRMINLKYLFPTVRHLASVSNILNSKQKRLFFVVGCCCCLVRLPFKTQRALHTEMYDIEQEEKSYGNVCGEGGGGRRSGGGEQQKLLDQQIKGERGHADIIKRLLTI